MTVPRFVRRAKMAGSANGRQFIVEWGEQSRVRSLRAWRAEVRRNSIDAAQAQQPSFRMPTDLESYFAAIGAFQVVFEAEDGSLLESPVVGPAPFDGQGRAKRHDFEISIDEGQIVNGLVAYVAVGRVCGLALVTQTEELRTIGTPVGYRREWVLGQYIGFPNGLIAGMFGYFDETGITGIGLRCVIDGVGPAPMPCGPDGRIVRTIDAGRPPRHAEPPKAPSELTTRIDHLGPPTPDVLLPNARHQRVDVQRVDLWDDTLHVHRLDGSTQTYDFDRRMVDLDARRLRDVYTDSDGETLTVHLVSGDAWIEFPDHSTYRQPPLPAPAASDGPTWDNVFSIDHRVDYLSFAFRGLDVSRMAPFDFQAATGVLQQEIFKGPAPGSRDFHIGTNGKATVVPNGWWFAGDVSGGTNARTTSAFSEEESRQTWATSLGVSADAEVAGAKVAYTNNSAAHGALSNASTGKVVSTIKEVMEVDHTIIVDLATVQLSDAFRASAAQTAADPTDDAVREFIERFGMHFAYAITFGSKSWEQRHETEESVADSMTQGSSQSQSVEAGYHSAAGGASASVSWGSEGESSESTKRGTGSDVSSAGSVGSAAEPVPILLDIEEITHLLSPVFFDDPQIYVGLRARVDFLLNQFPDGFDDSKAALDFDIAPVEINGRFNGGIYNFGGTATEFAYNGVRYPEPTVASTSRVAPSVAERYLRSESPLGPEGARFTSGGADWWVRGGHRHRITDSSLKDLLPPASDRPGFDPVQAMRTFPDSGVPASAEGKLLCVTGSSREVWWINGGKRHLVPSDVVAEVLGGWPMVGHVSQDRLEDFPMTTTPTSVEGKMIRLASTADVWVVHERKRFRVRAVTGIKKRGGWEQVAVVGQAVMDMFPDSGSDAL